MNRLKAQWLMQLPANANLGELEKTLANGQAEIRTYRFKKQCCLVGFILFIMLSVALPQLIPITQTINGLSLVFGTLLVMLFIRLDGKYRTLRLIVEKIEIRYREQRRIQAIRDHSDLDLFK